MFCKVWQQLVMSLSSLLQLFWRHFTAHHYQSTFCLFFVFAYWLLIAACTQSINKVRTSDGNTSKYNISYNVTLVKKNYVDKRRQFIVYMMGLQCNTKLNVVSTKNFYTPKTKMSIIAQIRVGLHTRLEMVKEYRVHLKLDQCNLSSVKKSWETMSFKLDYNCNISVCKMQSIYK